MKSQKIIFSDRFSSRTIGYKNFINHPEDQVFAVVVGDKPILDRGKLQVQMEGSDPLVTGGILAPDIDWKAELSLKIVKSNGNYYLRVTAIIKGRHFPHMRLLLKIILVTQYFYIPVQHQIDLD